MQLRISKKIIQPKETGMDGNVNLLFCKDIVTIIPSKTKINTILKNKYHSSATVKNESFNTQQTSNYFLHPRPDFSTLSLPPDFFDCNILLTPLVSATLLMYASTI